MPGHLRLLALLVLKDWRLFLADRRAVGLCFLMPVVLAAGFGAVFDRCGAVLDSVRLTMLIVNEDDSPLARQVVDDLLAHARVEAVVVPNRAEAERLLERRGCGVILVLPAGFGRALTPPHPLAHLREAAFHAGKGSGSEKRPRPAAQLLHHPLSGVEGQWAEGIVTEVVMRRLARAWLPALPGIDPTRLLERPFDVRRSPAGPGGAPGQPVDSYSHSFSGMTLQYLLFWGMESGLLFLRERQRGLWARLLTAPVSLPMLLLAKFLATAGIAVALVLSSFTVGWVVFGVKMAGSVAGFAVLTLAVAGLAASTGLLVATLGGTEARARSLCILVILTVSLLGGLWLPMFLLPNWAQVVSVALPTSWAVRGLDGVTWQGLGLGPATNCAAMVAGYGLVFLLVATGRFVRMEARRRAGRG